MRGIGMDIGQLPEGWKRVRLGEVCKKIFSGATPLRSNTIFWEHGEIPWLTNEEVQDGKINYIYGTREKVSKVALEKTNVSLIPSNALILSLTASVGKVAINMIPLTTNQQFNSFVLDNKETTSQFLAFYLLSVKDKIISLGGLTTFNFISKSKIVEFVIPLPPLPEQQRIAEILETVDNAIEKTTEIIEKYKRIKQGLMQDLLTRGIDENGNIRNEKTHRFKDSPLGRIPEEWEVVRLGEVFKENLPGEWGNDPISDKEIYPIISTIAISYDGKINSSKAVMRQINKNKLKLGKILLRKFDILLEKSGGSTDMPAGKVALVKESFGGTCSNFIQILRVKEEYDPLFIFYKLLYDFINKETEKYQQRTTGIINFKINEYFAEEVPLPSLPEQHRIAEILEAIDNTIEKEQKYKEKLERIKQGLMEDLLTGKVRVNHLIGGNGGNSRQREDLT
jgi:type I restriction enzyme S subunit